MIMMLQIGRMMGDLVAHNLLTDRQAESMISGAVPVAAAVAAAAAAISRSGVTCMDPKQVSRRLGSALKAGLQESQLKMKELAQRSALHQEEHESLHQVGRCITLCLVTAQHCSKATH